MPASNIPFFADHGQAVAPWAWQRFKEIEVDFGTILMEEGEDDPTLVLILEGEVAVYTGQVELGTLGPGSLVGEGALLGGAPRGATVRTIAPCRLLLLDREGYEELRMHGHALAGQIEVGAIRQLLHRLREMDERLANVAPRQPTGPWRRPPGLFRGLAAWLPHAVKGAPRLPDPVDVLEDSPLFRGASAEALEELARRARVERWAAGWALSHEGTQGDRLWVVGEGDVEVLLGAHEDDDEGVSVATLGPGDALGIPTLLPDARQVATCVALEAGVGLSLDRATARALTADEGPAGHALRIAMIRALGGQLGRANARLVMLEQQRRLSIAAQVRTLAGGRLVAEST